MSYLTAPPTYLPASGKPKYLWDFWIRLFENYVVAAFGPNYSIPRKTALLLHCIGTEGQRIFYELPNDASLYDPADNDYTKTKKILANYFGPKQHYLVSRKKFHDRIQLPGETVDDYVVALRELSVTCKFANTEDAIRDQFIACTSVPSITEKLLQPRNQDMSLPEILQYARDVEQARADARQVQRTENTASINYVQGNKLKSPNQDRSVGSQKSTRLSREAVEIHQQVTSQNRSTYCYRCGDANHFANYRYCPAAQHNTNQVQRIMLLTVFLVYLFQTLQILNQVQMKNWYCYLILIMILQCLSKSYRSKQLLMTFLQRSFLMWRRAGLKLQIQ